jgi:hypothetical protein
MAATNLNFSFREYLHTGCLPRYLTATWMEKYDPFRGARGRWF